MGSEKSVIIAAAFGSIEKAENGWHDEQTPCDVCRNFCGDEYTRSGRPHRNGWSHTINEEGQVNRRAVPSRRNTKAEVQECSRFDISGASCWSNTAPLSLFVITTKPERSASHACEKHWNPGFEPSWPK